MTEVLANEVTLARILDAAESEFALRGFSRARLEDIAAASGMRRASLLYHVPSKQALYERVLERALASLREAVAAALTAHDASYEQRLRDLVNRAADALAARPGFARLMLREILDADESAAERARQYVLPLLELGEAFFLAGRQAGAFVANGEPRAQLLLLVSALLVHAAESDPLQSVLWDQRAPGQIASAYREALLTMVTSTVCSRR